MSGSGSVVVETRGERDEGRERRGERETWGEGDEGRERRGERETRGEGDVWAKQGWKARHEWNVCLFGALWGIINLFP